MSLDNVLVWLAVHSVMCRCGRCRDTKCLYWSRDVCHPSTAQNGDRERFPGGGQQSHQGICQIQCYTTLHDLQLNVLQSHISRLAVCHLPFNELLSSDEIIITDADVCLHTWTESVLFSIVQSDVNKMLLCCLNTEITHNHWEHSWGKSNAACSL